MKRDLNTDASNFFSFARDYLHGYMPKVQGLSPRTIEAYRISLECFLAYSSQEDIALVALSQDPNLALHRGRFLTVS